MARGALRERTPAVHSVLDVGYRILRNFRSLSAWSVITRFAGRRPEP